MDSLVHKILTPSLLHRSTINKIVKPLKDQFDVNYFYYFKVTHQGDYSFFGNQIEWGEYYSTKKLYLKDSECFKPCNFKMGYNLNLLDWNASFDYIKGVASDLYQISHVFEMGYKNKTGIEFYGFASEPGKIPLSFYLNQIPLFKLYIKKIREEFSCIYSCLDRYAFNMAEEIGPSFHKSVRPHFKENKMEFLKQIGIFHFSKLSKRESEVAKYVIQGYTANEIGLHLNLSKRTIESYVENLKEKLNCHSKAELLQRCVELDSVDALECADFRM